jgi:hypothetical protein
MRQVTDRARRRSRRWRAAVIACACLLASVSPAKRAHAFWSFGDFYNLLTGGSSPVPTQQEAMNAYAVWYSATLLYGATAIPKTLQNILKVGTSTSVSLDQRKAICRETGGTFSSAITVSPCNDGVVSIAPAGLSTQTQECNRGTGATYNNSCVYKDRSGRYLWDDGPSIEGWQNDSLPGNMNYILLFWPAGQWHDYCYHHGERAYGYTREACDARFYSLMYGLCSELGKNNQQFTWYVQANCVNAASLARTAVDVGGGPAFSRTSSLVDFEGKLTADELSPDLINVTTSFLD